VNLKEKMNGLLQQARDLAAKAEAEERDFSAEERQMVANLLEEAGKIKGQLREAEEDAAMRKQIDSLSAEFEQRGGEDTPAAGKAADRGTLGERFVESPVFKGWLAQVAPAGRIPDGVRGLVSPPVEFKSLLQRKALVTGESDTSAGAFVQTDYTGIYEPLGRYPLNILSLLNRRQTMSDLVEFVRQTTQVQQAAPVPEANVTDYSGGTGEVSGTKPEGSLAFEKVQEAVKTIAVWIPATKRALSDASQIRGIIDQELQDDLAEELEDQIINGNGAGENYTGILNTAGILTQAFATDLLTTIRRARTALAVTGRSFPTALVLHPNDMETIDLLTDDMGRYYYGGPAEGGVARVWRVPVVESQSITEGTGLMGDFRKAVLWDREAASIQVSDSHSDFFIRNMVAILAEMRAAFGVIRPSAFCEIDLAGGS
jgi:HK97 family phage major capsid protein